MLNKGGQCQKWLFQTIEFNQLKMLTDKDRKNMQQLVQLYSFSHLQPSPDVYEITIPQEDLFNGEKRRIFYRVQYTEKQQRCISEIRKGMVSAGVFEKYRSVQQRFSEEIILKHLYASDFDSTKCYDRLIKVQEFLNNSTVTTLTQVTISSLKQGSIYTYGHDRGMCPIIVIRTDRFDLKKPKMENFNTVYFLLLTVLGFRMVPYHAEKYVLIFDFNGMSFTDIPYAYLYQTMMGMNLYYCGNVQKVYIFNAKGIGMLWTIAKKFISPTSQKKIIFINNQNPQQIFNTIDPYEMQKKYGGKLQNLTQYWPPKCTNEEFDMVQLMKLQKKKSDNNTDDDLYSVCNDVQFFDDKEGMCGDGTCHCSIF